MPRHGFVKACEVFDAAMGPTFMNPSRLVGRLYLCPVTFELIIQWQGLSR